MTRYSYTGRDSAHDIYDVCSNARAAVPVGGQKHLGANNNRRRHGKVKKGFKAAGL